MPKETSTTAHPEIADLADSLGYERCPPIVSSFECWQARTAAGQIMARLIIDDGYEVEAFTGARLIAWSVQLTSSTPPAALAAVMAVAAAEAQR